MSPRRLFALAAILQALPACIVQRSAGAHDIRVEVYGAGNSFALHTERTAINQEATASASLPVSPSATVNTGASGLANAGAEIARQLGNNSAPDAENLSAAPLANTGNNGK